MAGESRGYYFQDTQDTLLPHSVVCPGRALSVQNGFTLYKYIWIYMIDCRLLKCSTYTLLGAMIYIRMFVVSSHTIIGKFQLLRWKWKTKYF